MQSDAGITVKVKPIIMGAINEDESNITSSVVFLISECVDVVMASKPPNALKKREKTGHTSLQIYLVTYCNVPSILVLFAKLLL